MSANELKTAQLRAFGAFISNLNAKGITVHSIVYNENGTQKTEEVNNDLYLILINMFKQKTEAKGYLVYHNEKYPNLKIGQDILLTDLSDIDIDSIDRCGENPLNMTGGYENLQQVAGVIPRELDKFYNTLFDVNSKYSDLTTELLERFG